MTLAAIALKRYELRHGKLPASLEALVPEFLSTVPYDYMAAKPLSYRLKADGSYVLYSVGEDARMMAVTRPRRRARRPAYGQAGMPFGLLPQPSWPSGPGSRIDRGRGPGTSVQLVWCLRIPITFRTDSKAAEDSRTLQNASRFPAHWWAR